MPMKLDYRPPRRDVPPEPPPRPVMPPIRIAVRLGLISTLIVIAFWLIFRF